MLIKNGSLVNLDTDVDIDRRKVDIRVSGTKITQIERELVPEEGETVIDATGKLIAPGLVNAHVHSQEALFKGRYSGMPLELWMLYAYPILGAPTISPELVYLRTMLVAIEMVKNGVTTVTDDVIELPRQDREQLAAVFRAYEDIGLRANVSGHVINRPFIDTFPHGRRIVPAELAAKVDQIPLISTDEYMEYSLAAIERFHRPEAGLRYVLAPSGPQRCTDDLLSRAAELCQQRDIELHIHVVETKMQALTGQELYGTTMVEHLHRLGALSKHTTIAHGIWLTDGDIRLLGENRCSLVHNPIANLKLGAGIAAFRQLREAGVTVALGTDGLCNGSARLFDAIRTAGLLHNVSTPDYTSWPSSPEIMECATVGGATSSLVDGVTGSIDVGKEADIVLFDLSAIPFTPLNDVRKHLVYSEDGSSIDAVLVAGRVVYDRGAVTRVDEEDILERFRRAAEPVLRDYPGVEEMNKAFHTHVDEIHKWASASELPVNRYSNEPAVFGEYGDDSLLFST